jgi:nucleobase transporter 1/2
VSGIVTLLQSTFGTRLPIIQGSSFSFIVPSLAILGLPQWQCPASLDGLTDDEKTELWQVRIREIQGAIIIASLFEVFLGLFGELSVRGSKSYVL